MKAPKSKSQMKTMLITFFDIKGIVHGQNVGQNHNLLIANK